MMGLMLLMERRQIFSEEKGSAKGAYRVRIPSGEPVGTQAAARGKQLEYSDPGLGQRR